MADKNKRDNPNIEQQQLDATLLVASEIEKLRIAYEIRNPLPDNSESEVMPIFIE